MQRIIILMALSCALGGCAKYYVSQADSEYTQSRNGVAFVVPKPLSHGQLSHFYDLPSPTQIQAVSIQPPDWS